MSRSALAALTALVLALTLLGCGDGDDETTPAAAEGGTEGCEPAEQPEPKDVGFKEPEQVLEPGEPATATFATTCGTFVLELDTKTAPETANSFAFLAEEGVYDDTWFHRIVTDAFIQGGDPGGDGTGGPGYTVTEPPPPDTSYLQGYAAMAKTAVEPPGASGSQFFIVAQADAGLPADYAVFGQVTDGIDVVKRIASLGDPASGQTGTPTEPVLLESVTIESG